MNTIHIHCLGTFHACDDFKDVFLSAGVKKKDFK